MLLVAQRAAKGTRTAGDDDLSRALAQSHTQGECGPEYREHQDTQDGERERMVEVKLVRAALAPGKPDEIHARHPRQGARASLARAARRMQSQGLRLLGNPAVISSCIDWWVFRVPASRRVSFFPAASNMPNKIKRNKRHTRRLRPLSLRSDSVKDLLAGGHTAPARVFGQTARGEIWGGWVV